MTHEYLDMYFVCKDNQPSLVQLLLHYFWISKMPTTKTSAYLSYDFILQADQMTS